jgi:hypothetical protein
MAVTKACASQGFQLVRTQVQAVCHSSCLPGLGSVQEKDSIVQDSPCTKEIPGAPQSLGAYA